MIEGNVQNNSKFSYSLCEYEKKRVSIVPNERWNRTKPSRGDDI